MSKYYINEKELEEIFNTQFLNEACNDFGEWLDRKMEEGEIELIEFNHFEVSSLDYKPKVNLKKSDNILSLIYTVRRALKEAGKEKKAEEMCTKLFVTTQVKSYDEALLIIMEYVEVE